MKIAEKIEAARVLASRCYPGHGQVRALADALAEADALLARLVAWREAVTSPDQLHEIIDDARAWRGEDGGERG